MEKEPKPTTYEVRCLTHGVLGYVYGANTGLMLFWGHAEMFNNTCEDFTILPKNVPLTPKLFDITPP